MQGLGAVTAKEFKRSKKPAVADVQQSAAIEVTGEAESTVAVPLNRKSSMLAPSKISAAESRGLRPYQVRPDACWDLVSSCFPAPVTQILPWRCWEFGLTRASCHGSMLGSELLRTSRPGEGTAHDHHRPRPGPLVFAVECTVYTVYTPQMDGVVAGAWLSKGTGIRFGPSFSPHALWEPKRSAPDCVDAVDWTIVMVSEAFQLLCREGVRS